MSRLWVMLQITTPCPVCGRLSSFAMQHPVDAPLGKFIDELNGAYPKGVMKAHLCAVCQRESVKRGLATEAEVKAH